MPLLNFHYNVRPRYTAGSGAAIWDEKLAHRVAAQEKEDYERTLEGVYGPAAVERAKSMGLDGIVEEVYERRGGWEVKDLITGRRFRRETKVAKKLQVRDVVTRYTPQGGGGEVVGRFEVLEMTRHKDTGTVGLVLEGGPPPRGYVALSDNQTVTVENDYPTQP